MQARNYEFAPALTSHRGFIHERLQTLRRERAMINSLKNINFRSTVTEFTETDDYRFPTHFIFVSIHVIKVLGFLKLL